ncbi:MAG TPA: ferritin-like domain-containing protein [Pseudonocardiaceae bacterium]|nr:ferritin-like domain-containing protein [Pseudonocardiaceae bacterium]
MNGRKQWELQVSEAELTSMTRDLDEAHRETIPTMYAKAGEFAEQIAEQQGTPRSLARRRFLLGAGAAGAALALAACGSGTTSGSAPISTAKSSGAPGSKYTGDFKVVALATALENQAIAAYTAALAAATAGKLGAVPPAVGTFAKTAMAQHADHAKAWNAVLSSAGKPTISGVPLSGQPAVAQALGSVKTVGDVAKLALQLENQAAQTYLFAAFNVTSPGGIATAASIAPVEAMHAAVLQFVLGQYPVPDNFLATDMAANPSQLTV